MFAVSRRLLLASLCAAGLLVGCLSPTLPLPPPSPPDSITATEEQGVYRVEGSVPGNSHVTTLNQNSGLSFGQQTLSDGRYDFLVRGEEGDSMLIWYTTNTDESQHEEYSLRPR